MTFTRENRQPSLSPEFGFLMKTKPKKRWEVRWHQVLTKEELAQITVANALAKEEALKTNDRSTIIEWMILNTSLWGLRISESAHLKCGQVFLGENAAHLDLRITKGGKPRDVFIGPVFATFLTEYLAWKKTVGDPVDANAPFFLSKRTGDCMTAEGLRKAFKRAVHRGIERKVTPHAGRHTLGTHMSRVDLKMVQKILGHSSLATTEVYAHVLNPHIQEFVEQYETLLYAALKENGQKP